MAMEGSDITGYQPPGLCFGDLTADERQELLVHMVPEVLKYLCHHSKKVAPRGSKGKWFRDKHWRVNYKKKGPTCKDGTNCMCCRQAKYGLLGLSATNDAFTNEACELCLSAWRLSTVDRAWSTLVSHDQQHFRWWVEWTPEYLEQRNAHYRGEALHPRHGTPGYQPREPGPTKGKEKGKREGNDRRGGWQGHSQQQMPPQRATHSHPQQQQPLQSPGASSWQHHGCSSRRQQYGKQQSRAKVSGAAGGAQRDVFSHQLVRELQWNPPVDGRSTAASSGAHMFVSTPRTVADHRGYQPQIENVAECDPSAGINLDLIPRQWLFTQYVPARTNEATPRPQQLPSRTTLDLEQRRVLVMPDSGSMSSQPASMPMVAWSQPIVDNVTVPSLPEVSVAIPVSRHTGDEPQGSGASSQDTPSLDLATVAQRSAVGAIAQGPKADAAAAAPPTDANGLSATNQDLDSLD